MLEELTHNWWAFLLRGIVAVFFGLLALLMPVPTLAFFVFLFGAYALVDGILLVIKTIGHWRERDDRWLLLLQGLVGIGVGVLTYARPRITAVALLFYIAIWSLATGIMAISAGIRLRKEIKGEVWLILSGIASVIFSALLLIFPGAGALSVAWLIAVYALVFGVLLIILAIRLHGKRPRQA
jgi:uncharacterized membrane protein HdeD (DUF308 family)